MIGGAPGKWGRCGLQLGFFGLAPLVAATGLLAVCFVRAMTVLGFVVFTALILHSYSLISSLACSKHNFL